MRPVTDLSVVQATAGTVATPGTITGTGIDWSPTYEPDYTFVASCGAISAGGSVVAHIQASNTEGSGYTSLGSLAFTDTAGGTVTQSYDVTGTYGEPYRYVRGLVTCVGGTVTGGVATYLIGKARTL